MALQFGKKFLAMPGPTNVPDEVLQAMQRPAIDIYGDALIAMTQSLRDDLKLVFRTTAETFIYIANGHGVWEAALTNTLSRGDKILVLGCGVFAEGWAEMAEMLGVEVELLKAPERRAVDPAALEQRLKDDARAEIKAVLTVQIDTAAGVVNDIPAIREAIDAANHDALFMVDGVASIGCMPFEMDAWRVDVAITASQKGLMSPPGLGFVAAGERAFERMRAADLRTKYWDWEFRLGELHYHKYCGTPPEHLMFALDRALHMLLREEGLEAAWRRHGAMARAVRAAFDIWNASGAIEYHVLEPSERSSTVTSLRVAKGFDADSLRRFVDERLGVTLGTPIGALAGPGGAFRFAHMGHCNAPMVLGSLGALEVALRALNWPIGDGALSAATRALSEEIA